MERSLSVICKVKRPNSFGVRSSRQLALYIDKLRRSGSLKSFFTWHSSTSRAEPTEWDNVIKFLRACEYSLPEYFGAMELFVAQSHPNVNYGYFIGAMICWFRPEAVKELEEHGVPAQISERFARNDEDTAVLEVRLRRLAETKSPFLSLLEREWILDALPRAEGVSQS
jgi:hypothetical protein